MYGKHIRHARTHSHTHACIHRHRPCCRCSMGWCAPNRDEVNTPFSPVPLAMNGRSVLHLNKQSRVRCGICDSFGCFSRIKKLIGRTGTQTCDRMRFQTIRTVRDISRDDRARIATCSLLTSTDRFKEN